MAGTGRRPALIRGAIAGVLGALVLAAWFFVFDLVEGTPFHTPAFLASAVAGMPGVEVSAGLIAMYTALHLTLFLVVGILAAWALDASNTPPHFLFGLVLGFLLFDVVFYAGVVVTGVNVVRALGWPQVLAGNLLAGVVMLGYFQRTAPAGTPSWTAGLTDNRVLREGLIAGALGAVVVALWFLGHDFVMDRPFFTPAAFGSILLLTATGPDDVVVSARTAGAYTVLHITLFAAIGIVAALLVGRAQRYPPLLLGGVLLFVTLQAFAIGLIAIVAAWLLDTVPWWTIAFGNLLAAFGMGVYLWREHPELRAQLRRDDLEDPDLAG
jgi:hypothetical protein